MGVTGGNSRPTQLETYWQVNLEYLTLRCTQAFASFLLLL